MAIHLCPTAECAATGHRLPGTPFGALPEVTEVQRLRLKPGDALVIRLSDDVGPENAAKLVEGTRAVLGLDSSTPVLVLQDGDSVEVIERPSLDAEIARVVSREIARALNGVARQAMAHGRSTA